MEWLYEIRGSENRLVEARRGFPSKKEAETAARRAKCIMETFDVPDKDLMIVTREEAAR
jgi:hypothetical protein